MHRQPMPTRPRYIRNPARATIANPPPPKTKLRKQLRNRKLMFPIPPDFVYPSLSPELRCCDSKCSAVELMPLCRQASWLKNYFDSMQTSISNRFRGLSHRCSAARAGLVFPQIDAASADSRTATARYAQGRDVYPRGRRSPPCPRRELRLAISEDIDSWF